MRSSNSGAGASWYQPRMRNAALANALGCAAAAMLSVACATESPPPGAARVSALTDASVDEVADAAVPPSPSWASDAALRPGLCTPARSSEPIPARTAVTSATVGPTTTTVFVGDLFNLFSSACGGCHVAASQGGFQVGSTNFSTKVDQHVIDLITSTDPATAMPKIESGSSAVLFAQRSPNDSVVQLVTLLRAWLSAGKPPDVFYVQTTTEAGGANEYLLSTTAGASMTNIGDCIPDERIVGTERAKATALDAAFANMKKSPPGSGTAAERLGLPGATRSD